MKLKDRVRIVDLGVETDKTPVGFITKLWLKYIGTELEQEWALVRFDENLIDKGKRNFSRGVPELSVETSRLELME